MAKLTQNPKRYGFAPENKPASRELRQSLFKTPRGRRYRAVFVVVENEVRVLRIRGPGQSELEPDEMPSE